MNRIFAGLNRLLLAAAFAAAAFAGAPGQAAAQTIIDEWSKVTVPPAPAVKPVTVNAKTTALLVMDLLKQTCNNDRRPRCVASIPKVKELIAAAKAKGVTLIYTVIPGAKVEDYLPDVAPPPGVLLFTAGVDKFIGTDLEKTLKDKGITTVIAVGTAAQGAVLYTGSEAAVRGLNVIVPVEGMTSESTFGELATAWVFANAPVIAAKITLTKMSMITYQ